jgi:hypothetical protein
MIDAKGVTQPTSEIVVEHNIFTVEGSYSAYLVDNRTTSVAALRAMF